MDPEGSISFGHGKWEDRSLFPFFVFRLFFYFLVNHLDSSVSSGSCFLLIFLSAFQRAQDGCSAFFYFTSGTSFVFLFRGWSCGLLSMAANRNDPSLSVCHGVYISLENNNASSKSVSAIQTLTH